MVSRKNHDIANAVLHWCHSGWEY